MKLTIHLPLLLLLCISSCKLADIRTPEVVNTPNETKARDLLSAMAKTHHTDAWDQLSTYSIDLKDEFYGLTGKLGNPFPNNLADVELFYIPKTFTGQAHFKSGKWAGKGWGIQSWATYEIDKDGKTSFHSKNDKNIVFWLPTYQYFVEFPARIQEANLFRYAGTKNWKGQSLEGVFVSWKEAAPQKEIDQYILWLDQQTNRLEFVQYTVRDQGKWINATLYFKDYKMTEGLLLPYLMEVQFGEPSDKKLLHQMEVLSFKPNPVAPEVLMPDPNKGTKGKG